MPIRRNPTIHAPTGVPERKRTRHYIASEPPNENGIFSNREEMGWPSVLLIDKDENGQLFLYRFAADGELCGDTWHETLEYAIEQANFEYAGMLGPWQPVPSEVEDADEFVMRQVSRRDGG